MQAQVNGSNGDLTLRCWAEPNHDFPPPTVEDGVDEAAAAKAAAAKAAAAKAFLEGRCGVEVTLSGQQYNLKGGGGPSTYEARATDPYSPFVLVRVVVPPPLPGGGGDSAEKLQVSTIQKVGYLN